MDIGIPLISVGTYPMDLSIETIAPDLPSVPMLLEDGDTLLLENGDVLYTE